MTSAAFGRYRSTRKPLLMPPNQPHSCLNRVQSTEPSWWENDARGIPLCRVCNKCREQKLSGYEPKILTGYTQADVDDPIEPEDRSYERDDMP